MAIVYLDVDDEITSAASRMRTSGEARIALVLPAGSRLGTSRINFRLLAREAALNARDLSIVSPEAPTRGLALSAGLPVYATVQEYEAALAGPATATPEAPGQGGAGGAPGVASRPPASLAAPGASALPTDAPPPIGGAAGEAGAPVRPTGGHDGRRRR